MYQLMHNGQPVPWQMAYVWPLDLYRDGKPIGACIDAEEVLDDITADLMSRDVLPDEFATPPRYRILAQAIAALGGYDDFVFVRASRADWPTREVRKPCEKMAIKIGVLPGGEKRFLFAHPRLQPGSVEIKASESLHYGQMVVIDGGGKVRGAT